MSPYTTMSHGSSLAAGAVGQETPPIEGATVEVYPPQAQEARPARRPAKAVRIDSLTSPAASMQAAVGAFLVYGQSRNLSTNSLVYYSTRLRAFVRFIEQDGHDLSPASISAQTIREFLTRELEIHSATTANHGLCALRALFNWLASEGYIQANPVSGIRKLKCPKKIIPTFSLDQVESIVAACKNDFVGVRDRAILTLLFDSGLRASELCGIGLGDVDWDEQTVRVTGKGSRERLVSFGAASKQALMRYVARRPELRTECLFVTVYGDPIDRFRLRDIVKVRCKQAGVTGVRCSPHVFRHSFAVAYLRAGGDAFTLQRLLGHEDLTMSRHYCAVSQTDAIERHRTFSPADRLKITAPTRGRRRRIV